MHHPVRVGRRRACSFVQRLSAVAWFLQLCVYYRVYSGLKAFACNAGFLRFLANLTLFSQHIVALRQGVTAVIVAVGTAVRFWRRTVAFVIVTVSAEPKLASVTVAVPTMTYTEIQSDNAVTVCLNAYHEKGTNQQCSPQNRPHPQLERFADL